MINREDRVKATILIKHCTSCGEWMMMCVLYIWTFCAINFIKRHEHHTYENSNNKNNNNKFQLKTTEKRIMFDRRSFNLNCFIVYFFDDNSKSPFLVMLHWHFHSYMLYNARTSWMEIKIKNEFTRQIEISYAKHNIS